MNAKQTARLQYLTDSITRAAQYQTREGWVDGPVVFSVKENENGTYWFYATNVTDELRWFEKVISVMAIIGEHGGCRLYRLEHLPLHALGRVTTNTLRKS
jgi:hypothetical protein